MSEIADRSEEAAAPPETEPTAPEPTPYEPPDEEPVDLDEASLDDDEDVDVPGPREEDEQEVLVPKVNPVERVLTDSKRREGRFIQGPFLHFQEIEMYGLLGRATRIVLEGESGMNMDDLFKMMQPKTFIDDLMSQMPGYEESPDREDEEPKIDTDDAVRMLAAFSRLVEQSPQTLKEAYCIILDIPVGARKWAMDWGLPRLTRDEGRDIMETFIDQNWGVLYGFFTEELPRLFKRAAAAHRRFLESSGHQRGR